MAGRSGGKRLGPVRGGLAHGGGEHGGISDAQPPLRPADGLFRSRAGGLPPDGRIILARKNRHQNTGNH